MQTLLRRLSRPFRRRLSRNDRRAGLVIADLPSLTGRNRGIAPATGLSSAIVALRRAEALVTETLATGYTYQGKLVRPALVRVEKGGAEDSQPELPGESEPTAPAPVPVEAADS